MPLRFRIVTAGINPRYRHLIYRECYKCGKPFIEGDKVVVKSRGSGKTPTRYYCVECAEGLGFI